jgi:ferredoxin
MNNLFRSSNLRTLSFILALILALPFSWKTLTGFYTWLSPFIMLSSILTLKSFVGLNLIALPVLLYLLFRKRWFCYNICPAGWCFDKVSCINKRKSFKYDKLPNIGIWLAIISLASALIGLPLFIVFDPMAIFNGFFTIFSDKINFAATISFTGFLLILIVHLFFPGVWCARLCPLGGLQLVLDDLKNRLKFLFQKQKSATLINDPGRRYFIMSGIGLVAGLMVPRLVKQPSENIIRPPAAVEPPLLYSICCRCGNCYKVCPTGIIKPWADFINVLEWMTPEVTYKSGYCLETCNLCSRVCPTGAITLFSISAKKKLYMGTAEVHLENCLLFNNIECVKCKESCKYEALDFIAQKNVLNMIPVVNKNKCVGCGACKVICPSKCIEIKGIALNQRDQLSQVF